jgi:cytochrome c2
MPAAPVNPEEARDLVAYLSTATDSVLFDAVPDSIAWTDSSSVARGEALFQQYQCRGCHQLGGEGRQIGPALDAVGLRRRPRYLMALLADPDAVIPGTAMKNFDLWPEEIRDLTSFLMSLRTASPPEG